MTERPRPIRPTVLAPADKQLLALLGRRWMPRILWELAPGALAFGELRRRCDTMSSSVLSLRLDELRKAHLGAPDDFGAWELTDEGYRIAAHLIDLVSEPADPLGG